jgi:PAS domain S-box-containing protein
VNWPPPLRVLLPLMLLLFGGTAGMVAQYYGRRLENHTIEQRYIEQAQFLGTKLSAMTAFFIENAAPAGAHREVALTAANPHIRYVLILGGANQVLYASRQEWLGRPLAETPAAKHEDLLAQARAMQTGQFAFSPDRQTLAAAFAFPIVPRAGGALRATQRGIAFFEFDLSERKAVAAADADRRMRLAGGVLLGLCGVFSLLFHPLLTRRVSRLAEAAGRLAGGDLSARAGLSGGDELAQLSRAFDQMAADLQRGDAALRESEDRLRFVVEGIPQVFWLDELDPYRPLYVSPSFVRLWGRPCEALLADSEVWYAGIHPDDRERARAAFQAWINGEVPHYDATYRVVQPDGREIWVRNRGTIFRLADGRRRAGGLAEDITAQRKVEEEADELERKLQETQKLESLGVLAGGIAHDFNNLLTGILGNASLARLDLPESSPVLPYLEQIEAVSVRAADLCKQMLAYLGKGRFQLQKLSLSDLVKETTQLIQLSISKSVVLRFNLAEHLPPIEADATQMRQIVMNLVINASEAIGEKSGAVSISTGAVRVDREYLEKTVLAPDLPEGDYVFLEVSDNGCGMDAATQARIFDPFFTTKFTGRGLGLSAVLGIVRGHHGALKVYSEPGRGTTFKLLFPAVAGAAETLPQESPTDTWHGQGTVLVIDDEETVRAVAARMVQSFGFTAMVAEDGREGVEKYRAHQAEITIVLMDLTMPHLDGEAAFRELRQINPAVRVILMSGFNEQEAINRFTGKGLAGFLQKPFKAAPLRKKLKEVLGA